MWRRLAVGLASVTAIVVVVLFWPPANFAVAVLLDRINDPGPPKIANGVTCGVGENCAPADRAINATLTRRYPLGSSASALAISLSAQDFGQDAPGIKACIVHGAAIPAGISVIYCPPWDPHWDPRNWLTYHWKQVPCDSQLSVRWSADRNGRLTHIEGSFYNACM